MAGTERPLLLLVVDERLPEGTIAAAPSTTR
jgi:hypothetical protein